MNAMPISFPIVSFLSSCLPKSIRQNTAERKKSMAFSNPDVVNEMKLLLNSMTDPTAAISKGLFPHTQNNRIPTAAAENNIQLTVPDRYISPPHNECHADQFSHCQFFIFMPAEKYQAEYSGKKKISVTRQLTRNFVISEI